jgi:hypothetical protein
LNIVKNGSKQLVLYCNVHGRIRCLDQKAQFELYLGKHTGKTIQWVFENDKPYLEWCAKNMWDGPALKQGDRCRRFINQKEKHDE